MDGVDVDILRVMGFQPFLAWSHPPDNLRPGRIARELGLSPETVKDRIARLEASGVIAGYEVHPNLRHLGALATTYHFRVGDARAKADALADVENVEGVVGVFDFLGPTVCVDMAYRHPRELERKVSLIERLLDARTLPHPCFDYSLPQVTRALGSLDWRIIRALRGRARRRPEDVAAELGVSARTVRRRLERLVQEGSIDIIPIVDTSQLAGVILYEMLVTLDATIPLDVFPASLAPFCEGALCSSWPEPGGERRCVTLMLLAGSIAQIERQRKEAERTPGVVAVEVLIPAGTLTRSHWIDELIESRIKEADRVSNSGVVTPEL